MTKVDWAFFITLITLTFLWIIQESKVEQNCSDLEHRIAKIEKEIENAN
jgi:hypothetical protein